MTSAIGLRNILQRLAYMSIGASNIAESAGQRGFAHRLFLRFMLFCIFGDHAHIGWAI